MKKIFLILGFVLAASMIPTAHAQSCTGSGEACITGTACSPNQVLGTDTCPTGQVCCFTPSSGNPGATTQTSGFVPLTNIPGLTTGATATQTGLANFLNNLYKYLIGLAAILAVLEIIWGGLEISTQDSVSKNQKGKERIQEAILGLVLVLSPVLVFTIINPSILNLSLNLPPLNTAPGSSGGTGGGGGGNQTTTDPTTGCNATTGNYFRSLSCPTQAAVNAYSCPSGTTLKTTACTNVDATGKPLCSSYTGYCTSTLSPTPYAYEYYTLVWGIDTSTFNVVPRDQASVNAYQQACQNQGGTFVSNALGTVPFVLKAAVSNGCTADMGTISIDTTKYRGAACFLDVVGCGSPNIK